MPENNYQKKNTMEQNDSDFFIVIDKGFEESEELFNKKLKEIKHSYRMFIGWMCVATYIAFIIGVFVGVNL